MTMINEANDSVRDTTPIIPAVALATLVWSDAEGKELSRTECPRSLPSVLEHISAQRWEAGAEPIKLKVILKLDGPDSEKELVLSEGTVEDVKKAIGERVKQLGNATQHLYLAISRLMDMSNLKGAILTCVYADKLEGIGILSESSLVTAHHVKMLGEGAENQAKSFKDSMRQKLGITFPSDDTSRIIIPNGNIKV